MKQYKKDIAEHSTLHNMILMEKRQGANFATDALLWLKRYVHQNMFSKGVYNICQGLKRWQVELMVPDLLRLLLCSVSELLLSYYVRGVLINKKVGNLKYISKKICIRALHYFQVILETILRDYQRGRLQENMAPYLTTAYKITLEPYHNFLAKKTFNV